MARAPDDTNRTDAAEVPNTELLLAGDFRSPEELIADRNLSDQQKREVLEVWRRDLENRGGRDKHERLIESIEEAAASLGSAERTTDEGGR